MKDTEVSPTGKKMSQKKKEEEKKEVIRGKKKDLACYLHCFDFPTFSLSYCFFLQSKIEKKYREALLHVFYLAMDKAKKKKKVTAEEG